MVCKTEPIRKKLRDSGKPLAEAEKSGVLSADEVKKLEQAGQAVAKVIAVDDFAPEEITGRKGPRMNIDPEVPKAAE
jgi:acyl-CoA dehydrogenase